jgi:cytosolic iron-sulfur protein assembly protein CIAO1
MMCIATLEEGHSRTIRCCEWSPDGLMLASASFDGKVVIWESQDRNVTHWDQIASLEGHDNEVKSVAWSHSGVWLATCGRDKRVWVWERTIEKDFECVAMLDGHTQDVKFVKWHPVEDVLMSCSYDDMMKMWTDDGSDWRCSDTLQGHDSTVWGVTFDRRGTRAVSCSDDKSVALWTMRGTLGHSGEGAATWSQTARLKDAHEYAIYSVDWSHHHDGIATGAADNTITVCHAHRAEGGLNVLDTKAVVHAAHDGDVNCVRWNAFASSCSVLLTCGDDGCLKLWSYSD